MSISVNIAALRAQKGVTQEQLADSLGVSAPAVSKWESGRSCPDIALLKPLARYFGVRVDDLLDFEAAPDKERIDAFGAECEALFADGRWDEGLARVRALNREYPECHALEYRLACAVQRSLIYAPDDAAAVSARKAERELLTRASASPDPEQARYARFLLATIHMAGGETAEARALLESLPDRDPIEPDQLLPALLQIEGDYGGAEKAAQQQLLRFLSGAIHSLITLTSAAAKRGDLSKAKRYAQAQEELARLFGLETVYAGTVAQTLEVYAKAAQNYAEQLRGVEMFSAALLNPNGLELKTELFDRIELKHKDNPRQSAAMIKGYLNELEESEIYAPLRGSPAFEVVKRKLAGALTADPASP